MRDSGLDRVYARYIRPTRDQTALAPGRIERRRKYRLFEMPQDGCDEFTNFERLVDQTIHSASPRFVQAVAQAPCRQCDDNGSILAQYTFNSSECIQSVKDRHLQIHQDDIHGLGGGQHEIDGLQTI